MGVDGQPRRASEWLWRAHSRASRARVRQEAACITRSFPPPATPRPPTPGQLNCRLLQYGLEREIAQLASTARNHLQHPPIPNSSTLPPLPSLPSATLAAVLHPACPFPISRNLLLLACSDRRGAIALSSWIIHAFILLYGRPAGGDRLSPDQTSKSLLHRPKLGLYYATRSQIIGIHRLFLRDKYHCDSIQPLRCLPIRQMPCLGKSTANTAPPLPLPRLCSRLDLFSSCTTHDYCPRVVIDFQLSLFHVVLSYCPHHQLVLLGAFHRPYTGRHEHLAVCLSGSDFAVSAQ